MNGPGGYFGGCLSALDDCLSGSFGYTAPATLLWRNAATAHEHLSRSLTPDGRPYLLGFLNSVEQWASCRFEPVSAALAARLDESLVVSASLGDSP